MLFAGLVVIGSPRTSQLTKYIGYEYTVKFRFFKQFCQIHPVIDIIKTRGLVFWVAPKPWRLMSTT